MIRLMFILLVVGLFAVEAMAFETKAREAIVVDDGTQTVLFTKAADTKMPPSSMSKLMTLYVLFDKLKQGGITLDSTFPVSEEAWKKGGSKMFVKVNTEVRVEDLIRGIIVQSGNDACIVVAEALGGSEEAFAKIMSEKAREIGLKNSHFANSTGWPDEQHYMTAEDLAILTHRLTMDFPDYYPYFAELSYTYSGITQPNRNRLLDKGIGVDGLKTGHTEIAGYGITVSAKEPEGTRRVNVVVNGLESDGDRISEARRLVEYGFRDFEVKQIKAQGDEIAMLPVWMGAEEGVILTVAEPVLLAVPRDDKALKFVLSTEAPVAAPVKAGQQLAELEVRNGDMVMKRFPLVAKSDVPEAGFISKLITKTKLMLGL